MSVRDRIHRLIDELPEDRLQTVEMMVALALAPVDDEPTDPDDDANYDEDWQEYLRGEIMAADEARRAFKE